MFMRSVVTFFVLWVGAFCNVLFTPYIGRAQVLFGPIPGISSVQEAMPRQETQHVIEQSEREIPDGTMENYALPMTPSGQEMSPSSSFSSNSTSSESTPDSFYDIRTSRSRLTVSRLALGAAIGLGVVAGLAALSGQDESRVVYSLVPIFSQDQGHGTAEGHGE